VLDHLFVDDLEYPDRLMMVSNEPIPIALDKVMSPLVPIYHSDLV
jgi:hypothetical protein